MADKIKMVKKKDDECFGKKHDQEEQCRCCWITKSCGTSFKNRKD